MRGHDFFERRGGALPNLRVLRFLVFIEGTIPCPNRKILPFLYIELVPPKNRGNPGRVICCSIVPW